MCAQVVTFGAMSLAEPPQTTPIEPMQIWPNRLIKPQMTLCIVVWQSHRTTTADLISVVDTEFLDGSRVHWRVHSAFVAATSEARLGCDATAS